MRHTQRGNVLFLILLAVVLFAALAYAVTSSMRGGGKDASGERVGLLATQILNAATLLENTMQREMLMNNVPEYGFDVSGENSFSSANGTCTAQNCRVMTGNGGSVAMPKIPAWASMTPGATYEKAHFWVIYIDDVGTSLPDVVLFYRFLTPDLCNALNRLVDASDINIANIDSVGSSFVDYHYSGTLTAIPNPTSTTGVRFGDQYAALKGRRAFCHQASGGQYTFTYVLMAR